MVGEAKERLAVTLDLALTPQGQLRLLGGDFVATPADWHARLIAAWAQGAGHGLLQLGAAKLGRVLPASLAWLRCLAIFLNAWKRKNSMRRYVIWLALIFCVAYKPTGASFKICPKKSKPVLGVISNLPKRRCIKRQSSPWPQR